MKRFLFSTSIALVLAASVDAQILQENFTQAGAGGEPCAAVSSGGWARVRNSTPAGTLQSWFIPSTTAPFPAQDGGLQNYCAANYNDVAGANTISTWLITPQVPLVAGNVISFYTRTITNPSFPDRLQLRISGNGASTSTGGTATSVGDFTRLALDINPTYTAAGYPSAWTQFSYVLTPADVGTGSGRIAFRYFVESGGPSGSNSDYIGVDTFSYATPEPASLTLVAFGALALIRRKR